MSTGNKREARKSDEELWKVLGEGDTPKLFAKPVGLDVSHDVPYGAGCSVNGKTVYIDKRLYGEIMDGKVAVPGMEPRDIIGAWIEHEHTEWAVDAGDNPVDTYQAAHAFALAKEEHRVAALGADPDKYEKAISAALKRAEGRSISNPPRDLWCGPYLDEPTPRDKEILRDFQKCGVDDAFKLSKVETHYGISAYECKDCKHFGGKLPLDTCEIVSGLVRADRHCDRWEEKKDKKNA